MTKDYSIVYVCGAHVQVPLTTAERAWHVVAPTCVWCMYVLIQHPTVTLCIYALCSPCAGEVSVGYSSRDGYGTASVLVGMSSAEDESVVKRSTYASIDDVTPALYEVPVQNTTQYEVVIEHTTSAKTNDAGHGCYEVPVSENDRQYEIVVEHRTQNANAFYGGVGLGSSSAASSLFYQYVPSKVSTLLQMHI